MKYLSIILPLAFLACKTETPTANQEPSVPADTLSTPVIITDTTIHDTDDPAIWINPADPAQSLVIGTDKEADGGLYVFTLDGKMIPEKTVYPLQRPNNVDLEYGFPLGGKRVDIALTNERLLGKMRLFSVPDMQALDGGGIPIFEGEPDTAFRDPMGVALYKRPSDGAFFAIMGRKSGPQTGYLWQYLLEDNGQGGIKATLVRKFGQYSGKEEIEAIAVDDALGYVYYSDEMVGVRKYHADPEKGDEELALFGTAGFTEDHEGISIYTIDDGTGYILVSDQQANCFRIFSREGTASNPHDHQLVKVVCLGTNESDGSEVCNAALNATFAKGIFVAMSNNKTFQYYRWEDIAGKDLKIAPNGKPE